MRKIMLNNSLIEAEDFNPDQNSSSKYIYEVFRIIDGKVLFAPEHYERLVKSLESFGYEVSFTLEEMCDQIHRLAEANSQPNNNVKLIADNFAEDGSYDLCLFILDAHYPSEENYRDGVDTELYKAVRPDPHVKVRNQPLRDATNALIRDHKLFEVILVNESDNITEGSRSNIFFIKDGQVFTSPSEGVLLGVTRLGIMNVCQEKGIDVIETVIGAGQVASFDAAFISGTSPKVLPIRRIGDISLDVNEGTLRKIMELFDEKIADSLM